LFYSFNGFPDEDGIIVEQVVNVQKSVIVLVHSLPNELGAVRRALIRESWLQCLNRSSDYALPTEIRRSVSVWFAVPRDPSGLSADVEEEGKLNGDMLIINPPTNSSFAASRFEEIGSSLRWLRVAYFERYDFVLLVDDDGYVNIPNLLDFHDVHKSDKLFYSGGINSFERASDDYQHKYFAPFAELGSIILSADVIELLSREFGVMKQYPRPDITIGHFLMPYLKPFNSNQFIAKLDSVYTEIGSPITISHIDAELMKYLSTPILVNGKYVYPPLPAQVQEMESRSVFIDPHPKDDYPECDNLSSGKCNFSNLKMIDELKKKAKH